MLTLSGSNGYTGGTLLDAGNETLVVANSTGLATGIGSVTLNGGTLASGSVGTIAGPVIAGASSHMIAPGGVGTIGMLALGSSLSLNGNSTLDFDINGGSYDLLNIAGILSESGTALVALNTTGTLAPSYTLATFASSPGLSFSGAGLPAGYALTTTNNDLILALSSTGPATWQFATSGSWNTGSNWSFGTAPSGAGEAAVVEGKR